MRRRSYLGAMVGGVATGTAGCSFAGLGTETPAGFEQVNSDRFDVTRTERQYGHSVVAGAALEPGEYLVVPFGVSRDDTRVSLRVEAVQGSVDARLFTRSALATANRRTRPDGARSRSTW